MKTRILNKLQYHFIPNTGTIIVIFFLLFAYNAWAAPSAQESLPGVISYQGTLTDSAGQPISGDIDMTFYFYNQPTDGTALWTESHTGNNAVPVQDGLFHVWLGSLVFFPDTIWNDQLYLEIQIAGEPAMSPREMLGAVPYAIRANTALSADTALSVPDRSIGSRHAHLSTGRVAAESTLTLTSTPQQIPGTTLTLTPETDQTYLVTIVTDISVSDSIATAKLMVDGTAQSSAAILESTNDWQRGCVSQTYLVDLSGGTSHTMAIQAHLVSGSTGIIWATHTSLTYLAVSQ